MSRKGYPSLSGNSVTVSENEVLGPTLNEE